MEDEGRREGGSSGRYNVRSLMKSWERERGKSELKKRNLIFIQFIFHLGRIRQPELCIHAGMRPLVHLNLRQKLSEVNQCDATIVILFQPQTLSPSSCRYMTPPQAPSTATSPPRTPSSSSLHSAPASPSSWSRTLPTPKGGVTWPSWRRSWWRWLRRGQVRRRGTGGKKPGKEGKRKITYLGQRIYILGGKKGKNHWFLEGKRRKEQWFLGERKGRWIYFF